MTQEQQLTGLEPLSLNPETFSQGVGAVDGNQRVTEARYVWDNYDGNTAKDGTPLPYRFCLRVVMQADNGQVSTQIYSITSDLTKFQPSDDGLQAIPQKAGNTFHASCNMSKLILALQACGMPTNRLGAESSGLENLYMATEILTVSRSGNDFGDSQLTLPTKIMNMPWEPNLQPPVGSAPAQAPASYTGSFAPGAPPQVAPPPLAAPPVAALPVAAAPPPIQAPAPVPQVAPPTATTPAPVPAPTPQPAPAPAPVPAPVPVAETQVPTPAAPPTGQTMVEKVQAIITPVAAAKNQVFNKSDLALGVYNGDYSADPERDALSTFMFSPQLVTVATEMGYTVIGDDLTVTPAA